LNLEADFIMSVKILSTFVVALCASVALGTEFYCPAVTTKGEDRRSNSSNFRLVQFNVEWLFTDGADSCPGTTCPWSDSSMAQTHLSKIAGVIANLNPDVLNLCEVESCNELTLLTQDPQLSSLGYKPYMVKGTDSATGQDVGLLTKIDPTIDLYRSADRANYPIPETTCKSSYYGDYGVSKHWITTFTVGKTNIAMIAVHLLAIPDDQTRCVEREAQATVIASLVTPYVEKEYEIVILGDFNDWDKDESDANDNLPLLSVRMRIGTKWRPIPEHRFC
jgi:endonuclease/exonuclease/phosphatase family metal-dependent hydrolase